MRHLNVAQRREDNSKPYGKCMLAVALLASCAGHSLPGATADACPQEVERTATIAVDEATEARILTRTGRLTVKGQPELHEIRIRGRACAPDQELLEQVNLITERRGHAIWIEAKLSAEDGTPPRRTLRSLGWRNSGAFLDLEMEVPETLALDITGGSGAVIIRSVGPLRLQHGTGAIDIKGVAGDLAVRDGSGAIEIEDIQGSVTLRDGSGSISVAAVSGRAEIRDQSGQLHVRNIRGDLEVTDGSGDISAMNVEGRAILTDGSGDIEISRVGDDLTIGSDTSGDISVEHVEGNFTVQHKQGGSVRHRDIHGQVSVPD